MYPVELEPRGPKRETKKLIACSQPVLSIFSMSILPLLGIAISCSQTPQLDALRWVFIKIILPFFVWMLGIHSFFHVILQSIPTTNSHETPAFDTSSYEKMDIFLNNNRE